MDLNKHKVVIGFTVQLFCNGLESIVNELDDFEVVESIPIDNKFLKRLSNLNNTEILIVELNCPTKNDLAFVSNILEKNPLFQILVIYHMPRNYIGSKLIESGIDAYLLKSCNKQDIFTALNKIVNNKNYFCSDITKALMSSNNSSQHKEEIILTHREKEILSMLVNSKTNHQIAENLGLSENTVKTHRRNILAKFGVNNLLGMVRFACRSNLIEFGSDGYCADCPHCIEFHT